jgi:hypothetical protein
MEMPIRIEFWLGFGELDRTWDKLWLAQKPWPPSGRG